MKPIAHPRGVATLMAILILAFAAVALTAIAAWVSYDARRTREARQDAQLRQLLLAGAAAAVERAEGPDTTISIPTPNGLEGTLRLELATPAAQERTARIFAEFQGRKRSQTLQLRKEGSAWAVKEARLGE